MIMIERGPAAFAAEANNQSQAPLPIPQRALEKNQNK